MGLEIHFARISQELNRRGTGGDYRISANALDFSAAVKDGCVTCSARLKLCGCGSLWAGAGPQSGA